MKSTAIFLHYWYELQGLKLNILSMMLFQRWRTYYRPVSGKTDIRDIHPHPLPQDYEYAIIAQFFFLSFFFLFFFFFLLFCFWCYYDFSTNDLHVFMNSCVWTMRRLTKYTSLMIHQKSFFFWVITIGWKKMHRFSLFLVSLFFLYLTDKRCLLLTLPLKMN